MEKITNKQKTLKFEKIGDDWWKVYMLENHRLYNQFGGDWETVEGGSIYCADPESIISPESWISNGVEVFGKSSIRHSVIVCNSESGLELSVKESHIINTNILSSGSISNSNIANCNIVLSSEESSVSINNFWCNVRSLGFNIMSGIKGVSLGIKDSTLQDDSKLDINLKNVNDNPMVLFDDVTLCGKTLMETEGLDFSNAKLDYTGYLEIDGEIRNKVIDNEWRTGNKETGSRSL